MGLASKAILLSLFSLACYASTAFGADAPTYYPGHPPAKPPTRAPAKSPAQPPVKPPTLPSPAKPPVQPPVKLPVQPPAKPPVQPPAKPPLQPPAKPPVQPPAKPPVQPPAKPPVQPPAKSPVPKPRFPRRLVAVQGVVYCKSCKHAQHETLLGAKPVEGATVRLACTAGRYKAQVEVKSDKNGYFLLPGPKIVTNYGFNNCRVFLGKSPNASCRKPAILNGGRGGATLKPVRSANNTITIKGVTYALFNVGPLAYNPTCPRQ